MQMNAQKHLGMTISDIDSMNLIANFVGRAVWLFPPGKMVMTAKGIECHRSTGCGLSGAPNVYRRIVCDDATPGFSMANHDYGYSAVPIVILAMEKPGVRIMSKLFS